jgi:hypothetical protein
MEIKEFKDGYCLTHKGVDYKYQGKSKSVVDMISEKVKYLLIKDIEELKKKILSDNYLF